MKTTISKDFKFSAAHRLPMVSDGHKCRRLHGHDYSVTIEVTGTVNRAMGWIVDFAEIDSAWRVCVFSVVDHRYLNEIDGLENPTAETIAMWIWSKMSLAMNGTGASVTKVTVGEGEGGRCTFTP